MSETETFQDFVNTLESFRELKSGISGSRIKKLTTFALENVDQEEQIVDAIINYSKTCPDSHKLGSLYVIDSIGRGYLDEARARDDYIKPTAKKGSAAHAVYTLGESIQDLLTTAYSRGSEDHREKIRTLIDIWDRTGLFQKGYLNAVRAKCFSMDDSLSRNTTSSTAANNNGSVSEKTEPLPENPKERAKTIINNLKPLEFVPDVDVVDALVSDDLSEQQAALRKLLLSLQTQLTKHVQQSQHRVNKVEQPLHKVTEYGSRRERERQYERYSSRRNRSRSPSQKGNHGYDSSDHVSFGRKQQNFGPNNHHLYPDEMNYPQNPHSRPKPVSYDPSLPPNTIKVLSRTLFLGGVPMNMKEWDIAHILKPYADVQSVILNNHRKHAFVKVYSRHEAENVLMNFNLDGSYPLRTRWGVGFGPRDCCDYQNGYSIIPLHRLTDADKKWSLEAQWGGTNGQPLTSGMVFEEPDIIVGDGVSSKAISQRIPTDSSKNGPRSNRDDRRNGYNQYNQHQPVQSGYISGPNNMYNQLPPQQGGGYMGQNGVYGQPMGGFGTSQSPQQQMLQQGPMGSTPMSNQQAPPPPPPQQQPQATDAQAQLNTLMNMLNQQQQH